MNIIEAGVIKVSELVSWDKGCFKLYFRNIMAKVSQKLEGKPQEGQVEDVYLFGEANKHGKSKILYSNPYSSDPAIAKGCNSAQ